ncbi:MAG: GGDEF domain-containing protein, partial [Candidatus Limnocylindrales bacterium]
ARATDVVARVGGDEFMVLLPETDEAGAHMFVERVGHAAATWQGPLPGVTLGLSMGSATARTRTDLEGAAEVADRRMYAAKHRPEGQGPAQVR